MIKDFQEGLFIHYTSNCFLMWDFLRLTISEIRRKFTYFLNAITIFQEFVIIYPSLVILVQAYREYYI